MTKNKDYINIFKIDGQSEKMELVAAFTLEESKKSCIIYKSINNEYYAAYYDEQSNLHTDFSEKEKNQLNEIFKTLNLGGETNA